ncbi:MAG TPA: RNA-binding protein [Xanthobacteraceae bacterium]|nr:RNA-binding protein [Xanthobacteraceae bacterium]
MSTQPNDIELDNGPRSGGLERFCVATRMVRPVENLIRFVVAPDGQTVPDLKRKLPGRGVWVTGTQSALDSAIKGNAFARGFKRDVRVSADLVGRTELLLEKAALDALGVANKAGLVAAGFAKTETALVHGRVIALLHAAEAALDGVKKLDAVRRRRPQAERVAIIGFLKSDQLDLALDRPNVVHAALLAGPVSDTFLARLRRLERFRTGDPGQKGPNGGRVGACRFGTTELEKNDRDDEE